MSRAPNKTDRPAATPGIPGIPDVDLNAPCFQFQKKKYGKYESFKVGKDSYTIDKRAPDLLKNNRISVEGIRPIDAAMARPDCLMNFLSDGRLARPPHIRYLGKKLATIADPGPGRRILCMVSVRHGKSFLASWWLPVWFLNLFPDRNVILASYEANFAARWSRMARNTIEEHRDLLNVHIAEDSAAAHSWSTTAGGGMHTCGVGGPVTGRGADLLILDDLIKNSVEAHSAVYREKVWEWWQQTAYTRIEPGGSVVMTMARWHEDDIAGRIEQEARDNPHADQWDIIRLPAIAEAGTDDPLGRTPGQALWPERFDEKQLERIRQTVGTYSWQALYQQRPSSAEGNIFKRQWWRRYERKAEHYILYTEDGTEMVERDECWTFSTADLALSVKEKSCYSVIGVWAVTPDKRLLLLHIWRDKVQSMTVETKLRQLPPKHHCRFIGIEDKHYGSAIVQSFRRKGLPVKALKADTDKVTRAMAAALMAENGRIFLPTSAPWLGEYEDELAAFDNGTYDDQVDVTSYAAIAIEGKFEISSYRPGRFSRRRHKSLRRR